MTDPDSGYWQYDYDALGQLVWQQSPNQRNAGQVTTMSYDALGRMSQRSEPEYVSTWSYDRYADGSSCYVGIGKLCEVVTTNGTRRRVSYDGLGRPTVTQLIVSYGPTFTSTTGYDASSRVTSRQYPTGLTVAYSYTALGYLERLTNASAGNALLWQAQTANAWGKVETEVVGNGIQTRRLFDGLTGRIAEIDVGPNGGGSGPTSTNVLRHRYAYDSLSNLTSRIDDNGPGNGQAVSELFAYDPINRLSQYQVAAPAITNLNRTVDLQYNALGSILFKTDVGVYSYGAQGASSVRPHAVAAVNGVNYTYDANGNMTVASGGKFSAISYTSFNLPDGQSGAVGPISSPRYTWQYDADHQRIREDHSDSLGTRTTWYLHPDNVGSLGYEFEVAANGTRTNRHYLTAGGSVGVLITNGDYTSGSAQSVVKTEYWHKDHLGSIAATTDVYGGVTNRYAYDPFGKRRSTDGNYDGYGMIVADYPNQTDRGFTGHEQLDDIGIVHMNGRLYDANAGRFLQADPFIQAQGNLQSYNRYAYVMNNPLNATDPSGFFSWKGSFNAFINAFKKPYDPRSFNDLIHNLPGQSQADHFVLTHSWAYALGSVVATVSTFYCWGCGNVFFNSYYQYEATGSFNAGFRAAVITGAQDIALHYTGTISNPVWNIAAHAAIGCAEAAAGGGSCQSGALAGGFSAAAAPVASQYGLEGGTLVSALVGGTASVIGGGKFANGAMTGATGYLLNCYLHECFIQGRDAEATFIKYLNDSGITAQAGLNFNKYYDSQDNFFFGRPDIFSENLKMVWDVKPDSVYGYSSGADQIQRYTITGYQAGTGAVLFPAGESVELRGNFNRYEFFPSTTVPGLVIYRPLDTTFLDRAVRQVLTTPVLLLPVPRATSKSDFP